MNSSHFKGCLLGMAIGDAMGAPVDGKRYDTIRSTYGPEGLKGYDTANALAEITAYTQVALFACNGLLVSVAKGHFDGPAALKTMTLALKEWARMQHLPRSPLKRYCWLCHIPQLRRRKNMDARTLDALTRDVLGTLKKPANSASGPGTLTAAAAVGMYFNPERMDLNDLGQLGARVVALTHGDPLTVLCGAVLAFIIAGVLHSPEVSMEEQFLFAAETVAGQFASRFPQAARLPLLAKETVGLARNKEMTRLRAMEHLECYTAAQVLCGAMYAVITAGDNFDDAMITAVNHSGRSSAVGAVAGAVLGAKLGVGGIPGFYLESLEGADYIAELAHDFYTAWPKGWRLRFFDDEWDRKYTQGLPRDQ